MCKYIISRLNLFFLTIKDNCSDIIGKNVPYTITFHARDFVILLLSVIILSACERHSPVGDQMDIAEKLMNSKPDSALSILENIPSSSVKDPRISARYAMLKSMALDKNYIDTTNFDVLQPAIDYYFKNGTPNEKLRTYYYQGRIYQNQGNDDVAMQSFMNGCDLRQSVTDSLILAHTLVAQGTLYLKQYKTKEFTRNNIAAAKLYGGIALVSG